MLSDRFAQIIESTGLSQKDFAAEIEVTAGYVTDVLKGRSGLSQAVLLKIREKYDINLDWLLSGAGEMKVDLAAPVIVGPLDNLQSDERKAVERIIELFGRKNILRIHKPEESSDEDFRKIPVVARIAAGNPIESIESADESVIVHRKFLPRKGTFFALRVRGESMVGAGIMDGDLAIMNLVEDHATVQSGEIVAVTLDGSATLKRIITDNGKIVLRAENPNFPDREISHTDFPRIVGRYLGVIRLPKR